MTMPRGSASTWPTGACSQFFSLLVVFGSILASAFQNDPPVQKQVLGSARD